MKSKFIIFTLFASLVFLGSCNKYSEGPMLSLRSKKERIANRWVIQKAFREGNDVTNEYSIYTLDLSKEGNADLIATYLIFGAQYQFNTDGKWEFQGEKVFLDLDFNDDDADNRYKILKLKEDELWLQEVGGGDELHLQPG
jgi:hypothetical protein